jgi:hypothetical protein
MFTLREQENNVNDFVFLHRQAFFE